MLCILTSPYWNVTWLLLQHEKIYAINIATQPTDRKLKFQLGQLNS